MKDFIEVQIVGEAKPTRFDLRNLKGSGASKDVYLSDDKKYAFALYKDKLDDVSRARLERIVTRYRRAIFSDSVAGKYWENIFCWPLQIVEYDDPKTLDGRVGFVMPALRDAFRFRDDGAEKQGLWFASANNFNTSLRVRAERGGLRDALRVCLRLAQAVRRLHFNGLAHSDLSFKNCLINPLGGEVCILDADGVVVPEVFHPDVAGTPGFTAPEVVKTQKLPLEERKLPGRETDLHALATYIYHLLFKRHPLVGRKIHDIDDEEKDRWLQMGENALFIEHPTDESNRLEEELGEEERPWNDLERLPMSVVGKDLTALFLQAFIDGLHNPSRRPSASAWETALGKALDLLLPCGNPDCLGQYFVFDKTSLDAKAVCPYCGTRYADAVPVLEFYNSYDRGESFQAENCRLVVFNGRPLYSWNLENGRSPNENVSEAERKRVGVFQRLKGGRWIFRNETLREFADCTTGKWKSISPGEYAVLEGGRKWLLKNDGRLAEIQFLNN
ncbi:MAG: kinase [Thermoguttaceae bacterium]|nr:kinase [Thermoguttaceae bacterium]